MPMPGSQEMNSLDVAYFLNAWRWLFRALLGAMAILGAKGALSSSRWLPIASVLVLAGVAYATHFEMAAETMFYQVSTLGFEDAAQSKVAADRLVLGVAHKGEAKAYPIQFLGYHHQVRDSIGGDPVMVTYCTVCRTGKVFAPMVDGQAESFRLVGMDHFNALFEDETTTGSWWRQATGEAVVGKRKGQVLPTYPYSQMTLSKWIELYPYTLVMQPDEKFQEEYDSMDTYEQGRPTGRLTRRDTLSWEQKSWVIGIAIGEHSKAYDWNVLQKERIVRDAIGQQPMVLILSEDNNSFVALERTSAQQVFTLRNDTLVSQDNRYTFLGLSQDQRKPDLKQLDASQEYWHSWQTFHPLSEQRRSKER